MADTNGTGHPADTRTPRERDAEAKVMELLPHCSASFLGHLKLTVLTRLQRDRRGVRPGGDVGSKVAGQGE
jgi:hypothetical protein